MVGAVVVNVIFTLPFLSGEMVAGVFPDAGVAGFCPGALLPPGLVQVLPRVSPVQAMSTLRSPLPRPVMAALSVSVEPLSVNVGSPPCLNCGLAAAAVATKTSKAMVAPNTGRARFISSPMDVRRMVLESSCSKPWARGSCGPPNVPPAPSRGFGGPGPTRLLGERVSDGVLRGRGQRKGHQRWRPQPFRVIPVPGPPAIDLRHSHSSECGVWKTNASDCAAGMSLVVLRYYVKTPIGRRPVLTDVQRT
jgi:hypothetical protein